MRNSNNLFLLFSYAKIYSISKIANYQPNFMNVNKLLSMPGVIAVGEFNHRGECITHSGLLDQHQARMASIMCNANSLAINMQAGIMTSLVGEGGLTPVKGWIVKGSYFTVCVIEQKFCFLEQASASLNQIFNLMITNNHDPSSDNL